VVSWARLGTAAFAGDPDYQERFAAEARTIITRTTGGTGGWGRNVLSWRESTAPKPVWVRFDELISDPRRTVQRAVAAAAPEVPLDQSGPLPSFEDLQARDPAFFRAGRTGTHQAELPPELHDLFWEQEGNASAMRHLGFERNG
jgi:hypothetical protein